MFRRRDPALISQYLCCLCGQRIAWGVIRRILRTDPGQMAWHEWEIYAHRDCLRAALLPEVPLALARRWNGKKPYLSDEHEIVGRPCGLCGQAIDPAKLTRLRIQEPYGLVRVPQFQEESVPVHAGCLDRRIAAKR